MTSTGGSAADGVQREWEHGKPSEPGDPNPDPNVPGGLSEFDQVMLAKQAAERIEQEKKQGNVPAGLARWADEILKPKIDPRRELLSLVKHGISHAAGMRDFTYRKPARRRPPSGIVMPSMHSPVPRVTICIDTSGSMANRDLSFGLGLVASIVKALPDQRGVRVLAGDTHVAAAKTVFRAEQVELAGGGGTDMAKVLREACAERPKPQLVVLFTDGETPWPSTPLNVPIVAVITADGQESAPDWINTVKLVEEEA